MFCSIQFRIHLVRMLYYVDYETNVQKDAFLKYVGSLLNEDCFICQIT
jgi:hypothetical protein